MISKTQFLFIATSFLLVSTHSEIVLAKRTPAEQALIDAQKAAKNLAKQNTLPPTSPAPITDGPGITNPPVAPPAINNKPICVGGIELEAELSDGTKDIKDPLTGALITPANKAEVEFESCGTQQELEFEISGFKAGDIFDFYLNIAGQDVKAATLTLALDSKGIPRQKVEFNSNNLSSWPIGIPTTIAAGTKVTVRGPANKIVFSGVLNPETK